MGQRQAPRVHIGHRYREWRKAILQASTVCALRLPGCTRHATTADHIIPVSKGGAPYDPRNGQPACAHCNYAKGNRDNVKRSTTSRDW